jgi:hypothetical protein
MDEGLLLPPSLLSIPGVSLSLLEALFAATADFYALAPWNLMGSETPLKVCYPQESPPRMVVLMGAGGMATGLCAYDQPCDLQHFLEASDPLQAAQELSWLALTFESADYLAAEDLQAARRYGWKVAGEHAYPALARIGAPGPELRPPHLSDLLWLDGALTALNALFRARLDPGRHHMKIMAWSGPAEATITLPASGV